MASYYAALARGRPIEVDDERGGDPGASSSHGGAAEPQPSFHAGEGGGALVSTEVTFSQEDVGRWKASAMGNKRANVWLKHFRETGDWDSTWWIDVTNHEEFKWQGFIANHSRAVDLVGPGLVSFGVIALTDVRDPSVTEVRPRIDFMAVRADRTAVRLHPHARKEAEPIYGRPEQWEPSLHAVPPTDIFTQEWCRQRIATLDRMPHKTMAARLQSVAADRPLLVGSTRTVGVKWWRFLANLGNRAADLVFGEAGVQDMVLERHEVPEQEAEFFSGHRLVAVRPDGTRVHIWPRGPGGPNKTRILSVAFQ